MKANHVLVLAITLLAQVVSLLATPPAPFDRVAYVINVKEYGAVGDGRTDDTAAIIAARNAVLASLTNNGASTNNIPLDLYFPPGVFKVTQPDALMFSPTTGTAQPLNGLTIRGEGRRSSWIVFSSNQQASADPRQGNLMTLANRVRGLRVSGLTFQSTNANQSFAYMWCSSQNDGTYPGYGSGAQNDVVWDDIMITGSWTRAWGFDGDSHANQNSEQTWRTLYVTTASTFSDAIIRSGFPPYYDQQDQFLNYNFHDCEIEYSTGHFFLANKGGFINVYGGSFINGIGSTTACGTWFKMDNLNHFYDVKHLNVIGTRFEFRNNACRLIDTYWSGSATHITFTGIDIANNLITNPTEHLAAAFRSTSNSIGNVRFVNCELPGYHLIDLATNALSNQGKVVYEQCNFRNYPSAVGAPAKTGTFLRYTNGIPKYKFEDCYGTINATQSN